MHKIDGSVLFVDFGEKQIIAAASLVFWQDSNAIKRYPVRAFEFAQIIDQSPVVLTGPGAFEVRQIYPEMPDRNPTTSSL